jgi:phosphatidylglycerophosphate synthase
MQPADKASAGRRPLKSRTTGWAAALTRLLLKTPITPNQISLLGVLFALAGAGAMLLASHQPWLWLAGALSIQLRLLANMLDGLVAVEGQRHAPTGALYNELPDRIEDLALLVAAGYACGTGWLGWLADVLAVGCAYVRAVGGSLGLGQDFRGPMAKPHRMAALTLGALASGIAGLAGETWPVMVWTLAVIAAGTALTIARRTMRIAAKLGEAGAP